MLAGFHVGTIALACPERSRRGCPRAQLSSLPPHHQPPGLPKLLKHRPLLAPIRIEPQILPRNKRPHRHHIPNVPRHNVGHKHVNIFLRQPHNLPSHIHRRMHLIPPRPKPVFRRPHLRPPQPPARVAHKVIAIAVSPRLRHNHSHPHRLPQKVQLREFSHPLRRNPLLGPNRFLPRTLPLPARPIPLIRHRHQIPNQHTHHRHPLSSLFKSCHSEPGESPVRACPERSRREQIG